MSANKYRIALVHPLTGSKIKLLDASCDAVDLPDLVTKAMAGAFLAGVPAWLTNRKNVLVKRKSGLLKWETIPRTEWEPYFKARH